MLDKDELKKITEHIKDFPYTPHLDIDELFYYDDNIFEKVKNKAHYTKVLSINLETAKFIYGGKDIDIYKSTRNGHYVYHTFYWGD